MEKKLWQSHKQKSSTEVEKYNIHVKICTLICSLLGSMTMLPSLPSMQQDAATWHFMGMPALIMARQAALMLQAKSWKVEGFLSRKNERQNRDKKRPDMDCYARQRLIYSMQDKGWHGHRLVQMPCLNVTIDRFTNIQILWMFLPSRPRNELFQ